MVRHRPFKAAFFRGFESLRAHQTARLLKCRGPRFYLKVSPPSFGMYILSHEEMAECVLEVSRRQKERYENSLYGEVANRQTRRTVNPLPNGVVGSTPTLPTKQAIRAHESYEVGS